MMEKNKSDKMSNALEPVHMKLFATWEVDRTPSNCIPRLCTLRVTRLRICGGTGTGETGPTGIGPGAVTLAVRMHSSKRTLRSNDIQVPPLDAELDLCFSLQYPHFVKRDGNRLQIMLQRRKKYKNRTILGYKTLAEGVIRMDQVLQRSMDMELELVGVGGKGGGAPGAPVARLTITGLASTPVDHDAKNNNTLPERGYSDEEEEGEFSSVEETDDVTYGHPRRRPHRQLTFNKAELSYTKLEHARDLSFMERERERYMVGKANERDSDSELEGQVKRKASRGKIAQRNLKQKFAALLRRFKVPEELVERGAARDTHNTQRDIDELFQELESLSCGEGDDSGPDQMDTISIGSTPKPSLRPFFSSSRSLAPSHEHNRHSNESEGGRGSIGEERGSEGNSDGDNTADAPPSGASVSSSPPKDNKEEKRSRLFRSATSGGNMMGAAGSTRKKGSLSISTELRPLSAHDVPAQSPTTLEPRRSILEQLGRVLVDDSVPETLALTCAGNSGVGSGNSGGGGGGGGSAVGAALLALGVPQIALAQPSDARIVLQALLNALNKQLSRRGCVRVVVCGGEALAGGAVRAHAELAARYPPDAPIAKFYILPIGPHTIARYMASQDPGYGALFCSDSWHQLCDRGPDATLQEIAEISNRIARYLNSVGPVLNIPIGEAMVAYRERSCDEDSSQIFVPFIAEVRVGCVEAVSLEGEEGGSPPARPSPPNTPAPAPHDPQPPLRPADPQELHLDYWLSGGKATEGGDSKVSVKAPFRLLHVARSAAGPHLTVTYLAKEKKQKIMRLGKKKEKGGESEAGRAQTVDGVARLICSSKSSHNQPIKVYIDGTEWNGVKFFQLSTQWQTHVKHFPVATSGAPLAPPET